MIDDGYPAIDDQFRAIDVLFLSIDPEDRAIDERFEAQGDVVLSKGDAVVPKGDVDRSIDVVFASKSCPQVSIDCLEGKKVASNRDIETKSPAIDDI